MSKFIGFIRKYMISILVLVAIIIFARLGSYYTAQNKEEVPGNVIVNARYEPNLLVLTGKNGKDLFINGGSGGCIIEIQYNRYEQVWIRQAQKILRVRFSHSALSNFKSILERHATLLQKKTIVDTLCNEVYRW